jgi:radical SAM protein with 4Fe4S-binding SPASM domain
MRYFLSESCVLKHLERPSVYAITTDDLYELDDESFEFLSRCASEEGGAAEGSEFVDYCLGEGILTVDRPAVERPQAVKSPDPSLRYLELQITERCNLRCAHCYIDSGSHELPAEIVEKVLQEFESLQGLRVLITGGEPLLHSRFGEINKMLTRFSLRKVLFTNGTLLNGKILGGLNVDEVQISIDGLEAAHDSLRGRGTFGTAMEAIKLCRASGMKVSVSTMVHRNNLGDFGEMEKLFTELGVADWTVDVPCSTGRLRDNPEFQIPPDLGGKYLRYGFGGGLHESPPGFACGLHLACVTADGRISRCTFYADRATGTVEDGLKECWQRISPVRLDELDCDCPDIESCRGGCRYRAELLGNSRGKDLFRCALYDIIGKEIVT